MAMILGREQILTAQDIRIELVQVPEWGGAVYVRGLTGAERDQFESDLVRFRGKERTVNMTNIRAKMGALAMCDKHGNRLFGEADVKELAKKSAAALDRIFAIAQKLSGLTDTDVEELAKNFESDQSEDSTSA